jgi:hypothetical protein
MLDAPGPHVGRNKQVQLNVMMTRGCMLMLGQDFLRFGLEDLGGVRVVLTSRTRLLTPPAGRHKRQHKMTMVICTPSGCVVPRRRSHAAA